MELTVQLKLNIKTSVGESTPTEVEYGEPLPLIEVGVLRYDKKKGPVSEALHYHAQLLKLSLSENLDIGITVDGLIHDYAGCSCCFNQGIIISVHDSRIQATAHSHGEVCPVN